MKRLILASIALASSQVFAGSDYVYVYSDHGNSGYMCDTYLGYFETDGYSVLYADRCRQIGSDTHTWPVFPPEEIYISLDFPYGHRGSPQRFVRTCQFVGHAQGASGDTSSVIDCRGQANAAATAR